MELKSTLCHLMLIGSGLLAGCNSQLPSTHSSGSPLSSPSTPPGSPAGEPEIRILIIENAERVEIEIAGPYQIRHRDEIVLQGASLPKTVFKSSPQDPLRIQIGQLSLNPGEIHLLPKQSGTLQVYLGSTGTPISRRYEGSLKLVPQSGWSDGGKNLNGTMDALNLVGLEKYLVGVLHSELYPNFHLETYRAQAIASRTFALYEMQTGGKKRHYDVKATEKSQVYRGLEGLNKQSKAFRTVGETRGIVCTWGSPIGEKIFSTYFSSACGGVTQDVATCLDAPTIAPLAGGVRCNYCNIGGQAYRWGPYKISKSQASAKFAEHFPQFAPLGQIQKIIPVQTTPEGRLLNLDVVGERDQRVRVNAYELRLALGSHQIKSTHCRITDTGTDFVFDEGHGFGHGVGLCQWGAEGQARFGRRAAEILDFYYPGSHLTRAYR